MAAFSHRRSGNAEGNNVLQIPAEESAKGFSSEVKPRSSRKLKCGPWGNMEDDQTDPEREVNDLSSGVTTDEEVTSLKRAPKALDTLP